MSALGSRVCHVSALGSRVCHVSALGSRCQRLQATHSTDAVQTVKLLPRQRSARQMTARVFGQVVAAHKAAVANGAGETLLSCVCVAMTRQFIRPGKTPRAAVPAAPERLLTFGAHGKPNFTFLSLPFHKIRSKFIKSWH